jgi:hypothetical protein
VQPMMEGRCVRRIRSSCASGIQEALKNSNQAMWVR